MDTRALGSVALALLLVVAGCSAPATTGTESPTATPEATTPTATPTAGTATTSATTTSATTATPTPTSADVDPWSKIEMKGGNFSFDAAVVYRRVVRMHGLTLADVPDVTVYVRNTSSVALTRLYDPSAFEQTMGIKPTAGKTAIAGLAGDNRVYIYAGVVTDVDEREAVLAHEYAHIVQSVVGARATVRANVRGPQSQQRRLQTGILEGASTFVENRYRVRYLDQQPRRLSWAKARAGRTAFGAFLVAPYVFGHRYIHRNIDTVRNLSQIYRNPPQTTEQLIHNYDPSTEPALDMSVTTATGSTDWSISSRRTKGELFARLVLEQELSGQRAARAAAGWGNDRLVSFSNGSGGQGFAWTLRWDDPDEADEFAAALRDYLHARGERTDGVWTVDGTSFRVVRPTDGTVAVLAGDEAFVSDATVRGSGADYTVRVDGESSVASFGVQADRESSVASVGSQADGGQSVASAGTLVVGA